MEQATHDNIPPVFLMRSAALVITEMLYLVDKPNLLNEMIASVAKRRPDRRQTRTSAQADRLLGSR